MIVAVGPEGHPKLENATTEALFRVFRIEMQRWEGERRAEIEKATEVQQELGREIAQITAEQKKSEAERADEREKERVEMQRWADVRKKEHAEMRHIEEAKCVVQAKHVVQEGPTADQQELEAKLADLQQDQTLAEMNRRYRHSQSVLGEFTSSIEQSRVAQQSLIQAVVGIEEWRSTINSMIAPLVGEGRRTTWTSHVKSGLSSVVLLVTATFWTIQTMLNVKWRQVKDSNKSGRKRMEERTVLLFAGLALLFLGLIGYLPVSPASPLPLAFNSTSVPTSTSPPVDEVSYL